ncbi:3'-5' exonuclease [Crocinitomix catalasitica]|uniref:3'-5' exonuclease n=1 Tax=Crocinitomix catalasitica TaxID=184607 RepID=UPI000488FF61|nr:3'-5' exonuclease [Crocinitomix catalasitica]
MFATNITKEEINQLRLDKYNGVIELIDDITKVKQAFKEINKFDYSGFDTESKPVFVKGQFNDISLVQIATADKAYLFRIHLTGITDEMIAYFKNDKHLKIGVGLRDDIIGLQKISPFKAGGFVELNEIVNKINIEANGLRKLTAIILGFRISKNAQVSNWEAPELSKKQEIYAATDAWVCYEMYQRLLALNIK